MSGVGDRPVGAFAGSASALHRQAIGRRRIVSATRDTAPGATFGSRPESASPVRAPDTQQPTAGFSLASAHPTPAPPLSCPRPPSERRCSTSPACSASASPCESSARCGRSRRRRNRAPRWRGRSRRWTRPGEREERGRANAQGNNAGVRGRVPGLGTLSGRPRHPTPDACAVPSNLPPNPSPVPWTSTRRPPPRSSSFPASGRRSPGGSWRTASGAARSGRWRGWSR